MIVRKVFILDAKGVAISKHELSAKNATELEDLIINRLLTNLPNLSKAEIYNGSQLKSLIVKDFTSDHYRHKGYKFNS